MEVSLKFSVDETVLDRKSKNVVTIIGLDFKHGRIDPSTPINYCNCVDYYIQDGDTKEWRTELELEKFIDNDIVQMYNEFAENMYGTKKSAA